MESANVSLQFLAGGGENGELIRTFDWSENSLCDPVTWPTSLKTCVRIILTSRQPMFVWWGPDLINIYNDAYQEIVGGKHPWAMGKPASEVWHEIWDEVGPRAETALKTNEGTYDESLLLIMERNGYQEETYYTFSYSPVPGESGGPEGIICANTDDTYRIIGERQLRTLKDLGKAYINCKSDQDIYSNTVEILRENPQDFPFAIIYQYESDTHSMLLAGSTGNLPDDAAPKRLILNDLGSYWHLDEVFEDKSDKVITDLPEGLPRGSWPIPPFQALVLPVSKTGQKDIYGALIIGINPYRLLDDRYIAFFKLVEDQISTGISNVRAYEEERKRVEALIEIDRAKTVFFNNVSHEFRTPLTLMIGPLEEVLQQEEPSLPDGIKDNLSLTHRNALRLLKLVNSLLEFSRIEAGRLQASYRPVDIVSLTRDIASGFRSIIEKAGLVFNVNCQPVSRPVYLDREMWEKIVLNLLSNAFKFTLSGSITVTLKEVENNIIFEVADTGVGIPEEELPKMFERFHRVPNTFGRTHEGTGIGLSLINELVKMHFGAITVRSKVGEGSIFTVKLPTGKAHLPAEQLAQAENRTGDLQLADVFISEAAMLLDEFESPLDDFDAEKNDSPVSKDELHAAVLVVDDNADMRAYLQRLLEPFWQVETASNGEMALKKISDFKPDLVISDIMMPVMDGKELVQAIRNNDLISHLPVILLSARAGEEARIDGLDAGADDYLVKPFSGKELLAKVRSQINIAKARNHAEELLKQLFINAPMAIAIFRGRNFVVELANDMILELWGRKLEDVLHKTWWDAFPEIADQHYIPDLFRKVFETGERQIYPEHCVELIRYGVLEKVYVKSIYEPLRDVNGQITGVIALAHEITDLVLARTAAQKSAEEMLDLANRKDEFMSIASHELKTPITSMKASLQILERLPLDDRASNFVGKANRQMSRLSALVGDLLDVTSLQAGKMKFYFESFSLNDMLADVIEQHEQSQSTHQITLMADDEILIHADRNRLEQVVNNLLSNAIKYSPQSNRVMVITEKTEGRIRVCVRDFGIGIPPDKVDQIFDRFYRVEESSQNFAGLGLGLFISSEIIKRHHGEIGVYRNEDVGSTFWFTLPN